MIDASTLEFDELIDHLFARDLDSTAFSLCVEDPVTIAHHLIRLFELPRDCFDQFTDRQLGQGVNTISWLLTEILDESVPFSTQARVIASTVVLFREYFAAVLPPALFDSDESSSDGLAGSVFMFWDNCLLGWTLDEYDKKYVPLVKPILAALDAILHLDSMACQESALHGLNHGTKKHRQEVKEIIDRYLARHPAIRPELRQYAEQAKAGKNL